jgi:uroporphyrinogen decarboxylase
MNSRERFWKWANYESVDKIPDWADWLGPWETWLKQGLPAPAHMTQDSDWKAWFIDHFGFEGMFSAFWGQPRVPVDIGPYPAFEREVFEEKGNTILFRSGNGVIVRQFSHPGSSLISTEFVEYPIKNRKDWERYRDEHLNPEDAGRYPDPETWEVLKAGWKDRDFIISIDGGSFYGFLRDWIGFENLSFFLYDDPDLVQEMMDTLADFFIRVLEKAVSEVQIDFAMFWEDMCYKAGPLLSPAHFRKFMLPNYQKVTDFLGKHGVKLSWVDCDGNIEDLLPLWIEGGVRGFYPLEVASGMDAAKLQQKYGKSILMWGNVDKRALSAGRMAIDLELQRLAPIVRRGGLIPLVDHGVPDDVPYENYLYYLEQRRKLKVW